METLKDIICDLLKVLSEEIHFYLYSVPLTGRLASKLLILFTDLHLTNINFLVASQM